MRSSGQLRLVSQSTLFFCVMTSSQRLLSFLFLFSFLSFVIGLFVVGVNGQLSTPHASDTQDKSQQNKFRERPSEPTASSLKAMEDSMLLSHREREKEKVTK